MSLPNTYTPVNETGCCAKPNVADWDRKTHEFAHRHFIRMHTKSVLHIPLDMGKVMTALQQAAQAGSAEPPPEEAMILSRDLSPWRAEHLYAVTHPIEGADNVELNGSFVSMVFEGSYGQVRTWHKELNEYIDAEGRTPLEVYSFYTTCPSCAKHYGKNYVVCLARVATIAHPSVQE
jgi:hypothetical protein